MRSPWFYWDYTYKKREPCQSIACACIRTRVVLLPTHAANYSINHRKANASLSDLLCWFLGVAAIYWRRKVYVTSANPVLNQWNWFTNDCSLSFVNKAKLISMTKPCGQGETRRWHGLGQLSYSDFVSGLFWCAVVWKDFFLTCLFRAGMSTFLSPLASDRESLRTCGCLSGAVP